MVQGMNFKIVQYKMSPLVACVAGYYGPYMCFYSNI